MTRLTEKGIPRPWPEDPPQPLVFQMLKNTFASAPILQHFDYKETVVETDASDFVSNDLLYQPDDKRILYPVVSFSNGRSPARCNYKIYGKDLPAINRYSKNEGRI